MSFSSYIERKYITIAPEPFIKYTFRVRFLPFFLFFFPVIRISFSCADYFNNIRHGDEFSTSKLVQLCKICCSSLFCIYFSTLVLIPLSRLGLLLVVSTIKVDFFKTISTNHFVRAKYSLLLCVSVRCIIFFLYILSQCSLNKWNIFRCLWVFCSQILT